MLWHIFKNGWEDKEFIGQRVYGMDDVRKEVENGRPRKSSASPACRERSSSALPRFRQGEALTLIWAMGQTQHTVGTANVRASCILLLATGNVGEPGSGANIFRGHDQRAGRDRPRPRCRDAAALLRPCRGRLAALVPRLGSRLRLDARPLRLDKKMMETPGIPSTRWFDATLLPKDQVAQKDNLKAMFVHGSRRQHHHPHAGSGQGHREARPAGRGRPASDDVGGALGAQGRHVPAADCNAVREQRLAHGVQPRAAMGRADRQADLRIQGRLRDHVPAGEEARLRRPDVQEHQGREQPAGRRRTSCARSIAAAGRPAIAASRRSG